MTVFVCEDSIDGIFTAVYDAWASRLGHDNVKIQVQQYDTLEFFAEYVQVVTDMEKSMKVSRTINNRLGYENYLTICYAAMGNQKNKEDDIYRVIAIGLAMADGTKVLEHLSNDSVNSVFKLRRTVWNEVHRYCQFVRFQELEQGILFSKIAPKHNVLTAIAPHFEDRFPNEDFVIYDEVRHQAVLHQKQKSWILLSGETIDENLITKYTKEEELFQELWKSFFRSVGIKERKNPRCQRTMLPIRYRDNIVEFQDNSLG